MAAHKVLLIAYQFPPVGGGGIQRVTKFVKYFRHFGWEPTVLTVSNPSVPLLDEGIAADLPKDIEVIRAKTFEPGYGTKSQDSENTSWLKSLKGLAIGVARHLLQPDPQLLWIPNAWRAAKPLLKDHDVIMVSAPPFSSMMLGAAFSRWSGKPLVLDYRDEWLLSLDHWENRQASRLTRRWNRWLEDRVLRQASQVIATTDGSVRSMQRRCSEAGAAAPVATLPNGFDAEDFQSVPRSQKQPGGKFRIVYTGTLWKLTSIAPLVEAMRRKASRDGKVWDQIEWVFAGRVTPSENDLLDEMTRLGCSVEIHPYLTHLDALQLVVDSDCLLLTLSGHSDAQRVMPAKVFEYLAANRPILAIAPNGEATNLLRRFSGTDVQDPRAIDNIISAIDHLADHRPVLQADSQRTHLLRQFDRREQTRVLSDLLASTLPESQLTLDLARP